MLTRLGVTENRRCLKIRDMLTSKMEILINLMAKSKLDLDNNNNNNNNNGNNNIIIIIILLIK